MSPSTGRRVLRATALSTLTGVALLVGAGPALAHVTAQPGQAEQVAWDQPPAADGSEPERPAPAVALTPAGAAPGEPAPAPAMAAQPMAAVSPTDTTARWLGGTGLLLGALGLGLGVGALLRGRRGSAAEQ